MFVKFTPAVARNGGRNASAPSAWHPCRPMPGTCWRLQVQQVHQPRLLQELQGQDGDGRLAQGAEGSDLHSLVLGHHMVDFFLNLTLCQQLIVEENPLGPEHPPVYQVLLKMCVSGDQACSHWGAGTGCQARCSCDAAVTCPCGAEWGAAACSGPRLAVEPVAGQQGTVAQFAEGQCCGGGRRARAACNAACTKLNRVIKGKEKNRWAECTGRVHSTGAAHHTHSLCASTTVSCRGRLCKDFFGLPQRRLTHRLSPSGLFPR